MNSHLFGKKLLSAFLAVLMALSCFTGAMSAYAASADIEQSLGEDNLKYNFLGWVEATDEQVLDGILDFADKMLNENMGTAHNTLDMSVAGSLEYDLTSVNGLLATLNNARSFIKSGLVGTLAGGDLNSINLGGELIKYASTGGNGEVMTRENSSSKEIIRGILNILYMNSNNYAKNANAAYTKNFLGIKSYNVFDGGQIFQHLVNGSFGIGGLEGIIVSLVKSLAKIDTNGDNTVYGIIGGLLGAPQGFEKDLANNVVIVMLKKLVADSYAEQGMVNTINTSGTSYYFVDAQNNKMTLEQWAFDAINKCVLDTLKGADTELIYKDSGFAFDVNANAYDTIYGAFVPLFEHTLLPLFSTISLDFNFVTHFTKMYYEFANGVAEATGNEIDASSQAKLDSYWTAEKINNWIALDYVELGKYIGGIQTPESTEENRIYKFPGMAVFDENDKVIGIADDVTAADVKDAMIELFNSYDRHSDEIDASKLFGSLLYSPVAEALGCETGILNLNLKDYYLTKFNINNFFDFTVFNGGSIKDDVYALLVEMLSFLFPGFDGWAAKSGTQTVDRIVEEVVESAGSLIKYVGNSISPAIFAHIGDAQITESNFETAMLPFLRAIFGDIDITKQIHEEDWDKCTDFESMLFVALNEYLKYCLPQYDYSFVGHESNGQYHVVFDELLLMARDALAYVMQNSVPITTDGVINSAKAGQEVTVNEWDVFTNGGTANGAFKDTKFTAFDMLNALLVYYANNVGIAQLLNLTKYSVYGTTGSAGYESAITNENTIWQNLDIVINKAFPILKEFLGVTTDIKSEQIIMDGLVNNILNMGDVNNTAYGHGKQGISAILYNLVYAFAESAPMTQKPILVVVYGFLRDILNVIFGARDNKDGFGVFLPANTGVQPISDLLSNKVLGGGSVSPSSACDMNGYSGEGVIGIMLGRLCENSLAGELYTKGDRAITDTVLPGLAGLVKMMSDLFGFIPSLGESNFTSPEVKFSQNIIEGTDAGNDIYDTYIGVKNIAQGLNTVIFEDGSKAPTQLPRYYVRVLDISCATDELTADVTSRYAKTPVHGATIEYRANSHDVADVIAPGDTAYYLIEGYIDTLGAKEMTVTYQIEDKNGATIGEEREYTVSGQFLTTDEVSVAADPDNGVEGYTVTFTPEKKAPSKELAERILTEVKADRDAESFDETNFDIFTYRLMVKAAQRAEKLVYGTYEKQFVKATSADDDFQAALTYDFYANETGDAETDTFLDNTTLALFLGNVAEGKYADKGIAADAVVEEGVDFYFGKWEPTPEYLDENGDIIYDYVTDADEATVNEAIRMYNLYKNEIIHRGYVDNDLALLKEVLCATGDTFNYNNNTATLRNYINNNYAVVDGNVTYSGSTIADAKYGVLENGVLVNKDKDAVYTEESWNNYIDALSAAITCSQTAASADAYNQAMYNENLTYAHQVTDISAYRTAVMIAENELEEYVEEPSDGYNVTAYIGALATPSDEFGTYAVTGATVTAGGITAVTDADGKFTLEGLSDGTYEATVTYQYGFTRTFTIVVNGADVVSDVKVGIVGCDLSGDGAVNTGDYNLYKKFIGVISTNDRYIVGYDFNRDGAINTGDYNIYKQFVGKTSVGMTFADTVVK